MFPTYASFRSKLLNSAFNVSLISGTTTTVSAGNYNVYLQFENRAGRNLLSEAQNISIAESEGIRVTINSDAIASGEEVFAVVISFEKSNNPQDAVRVASWQARENNQLADRSLPVTIDFTTDEHFKLTRAVANIDGLPSLGIKNGAIALAADTGKYYRYDAESYTNNDNFYSYGALAVGNPAKKWVEYDGSFATYLANTTNSGGSDRRLSAIANALKIPPKIGSGDSTPLRIWLNNGLEADGQSPIVRGKYSLEISVDGATGFENLFADKIKYTLRGYCDRAIGLIDTSIAEVGVQKIWNPSSGLIILPAELPRGHAAVYDLVLSFGAEEMLGKLPSKPVIGIDVIDIFSIQPRKSDFAEFLGDIVYSDLDKLVIVPGLKRLAGKASISEGFIIDDLNDLMITGAQADTPNQIAAMSGALNGFITVRQQGDALAYSEVIRAVFSTEPGISQLVAASAVALNNQGIEVTVNHPFTGSLTGKIRSDYPDTSIAGNEKALFTGYKGYLYLQVNSTIYRSNLLSFASTPQVINVNNLNNFTAIASLPTQSDPYFSLFKPDSVSRSAITGTITGTVTAYFAYAYESNNTLVTKINHNVSNAIPTANLPLSEVINNLTAITEHLDNYNNPHQVTRAQLGAASQSDLTTHVSSVNNPHQVTATQINAATTAQLATTNNNVTANTAAIALNTASRQSLGTAATKNVGTAINNVVQLQDVGGVAKLPAVDGSQLTGISGQLTVEFQSGTFTAVVSTSNPVNYLIDTSSATAIANLPPTPPNKGIVAFSDRRKTFGTNTATIVPSSGHTINGQSNLLLDTNNKSVVLIFDSANNNYSLT